MLGQTLKPGVYGDPVPAIQDAISAAAGVWGSHGLELRITALQDGTHQCCAHAQGRAVDLGTKDASGRQYPASLKAQLAAELSAAIGGQFRVLIESDHIHVQTSATGGSGGSGAASGGGGGGSVVETVMGEAGGLLDGVIGWAEENPVIVIVGALLIFSRLR